MLQKDATQHDDLLMEREEAEVVQCYVQPVLNFKRMAPGACLVADHHLAS